MRDDGCGAHGTDVAGRQQRNDDCVACRNWDYSVWSMADQQQLADILCELDRDKRHNRHGDHYDHAKWEWRQAGMILGALLRKNRALGAAPGPCTSCGDSPAAPLHDNVIPPAVGQHPYQPSRSSS